jgi:hypothetical protein
MPIPPTIPDQFESAVNHAIRQKRWMARNHAHFAEIFAWTFVGLCVGGIYFAERIGVLAYGIAWTLCAMLVTGLLSSSRSVGAEADRLEIYAANRGEEARKLILKELNRLQPEDSTSGFSALREAILNGKT